MPAKIAVIYYTTYGHIKTLSEEVIAGAKSSGAQVDVYQIPETLSDEILQKQHAMPRPDLPVITGDLLTEYDGFIFGFPTRYGRAPAQVSAFFDSTGKQWASGALVGKFASIFTSAASQHGGLETTQLTTMPFFAHHGICYVPPGFASTELTLLDDVHGGSAYGAGTIAGGDGARQPTKPDLAVAKAQGTYFANFVNTFVAGKAKLASVSTAGVAAEKAPSNTEPAMHTTGAASKPQEGYAVGDQTAQPATSEATPVVAPAAVPATTQTPATAQKTEEPAGTTANAEQKPAKKSSIFARCCGKESDYKQ